jgi:hypothetical protein
LEWSMSLMLVIGLHADLALGSDIPGHFLNSAKFV